MNLNNMCPNLTVWMQLHDIVQQQRSFGSASRKSQEATIQTRRECAKPLRTENKLLLGLEFQYNINSPYIESLVLSASEFRSSLLHNQLKIKF